MDNISYDKANSKILSELKRKYESELSALLTEKAYDIYSKTGVVADFSSIERCISVEKDESGSTINKSGWFINIKFNF